MMDTDTYLVYCERAMARETAVHLVMGHRLRMGSIFTKEGWFPSYFLSVPTVVYPFAGGSGLIASWSEMIVIHTHAWSMTEAGDHKQAECTSREAGYIIKERQEMDLWL